MVFEPGLVGKSADRPITAEAYCFPSRTTCSTRGRCELSNSSTQNPGLRAAA